MGRCEFPVSGGQPLRVVQFPVLVHGAGAVGVEFAVFVLAGLLVIEKVNTCHGQHGYAAVRTQNQLFGTFVKAEQGTVRGIGKIRIHDFGKNAVQDFHVRGKISKNLFCKQFGLVAGAHILPVMDGGGGFHILGDAVKIRMERLRVTQGVVQIFPVQGLQFIHVRYLLPV